MSELFIALHFSIISLPVCCCPATGKRDNSSYSVAYRQFKLTFEWKKIEQTRANFLCLFAVPYEDSHSHFFRAGQSQFKELVKIRCD